MKHDIKITAVLLAMFLLTQFIGMYVVNHYSTVKVVNGEIQNVSSPPLPFGIETPEIKEQSEYMSFFSVILFAFVIAVALLFFLTKLKIKFILKAWFFVVIIIALAITLNSFFSWFKYASILALAVALPLAFIKIFRRNMLVHNATELLIYPGIAAVFVPILNVWTIIILLVLISIYDMWAVWRSGIMQKMAKYQINELKIFSGFFVPYISKKLREKLKKLKKFKSKAKEKRIKVNIAILGGGDVIFPIIAAGVMLKTFGFLSALFVIVGALLGLSYLFFFSEKKKFYPAMPFITAGIFLGIGLSFLLNYLGAV